MVEAPRSAALEPGSCARQAPKRPARGPAGAVRKARQGRSGDSPRSLRGSGRQCAARASGVPAQCGLPRSRRDSGPGPPGVPDSDHRLGGLPRVGCRGRAGIPDPGRLRPNRTELMSGVARDWTPNISWAARPTDDRGPEPQDPQLESPDFRRILEGKLNTYLLGWQKSDPKHQVGSPPN